MEYLIIHCNRCGTPQYITSTQKTRTCPRCRQRIVCSKMKVIARTSSIKEANQMVRDMKTPSEVKQRISMLSEKYKSSKSQEDLDYEILGELISEMSAVFPRAIPQNILLERAKELGIETLNIIEDIFSKLNQQGLLLINKNSRGQITLHFPSIPFKFNKLFVNKPKNTQDFQRESEKKWKTSTK